MTNEVKVANLSDYFARRESQYAEGNPVLSQPPKQSVAHCFQFGSIKEGVEMARFFLKQEEQAFPTWYMAKMCPPLGNDPDQDVTQEDVEQWAVNIGLDLIYVDAKKFGAKRKGLRKSVIINHSRVRVFLGSVKKEYKNRREDA